MNKEKVKRQQTIHQICIMGQGVKYFLCVNFLKNDQRLETKKKQVRLINCNAKQVEQK